MHNNWVFYEDDSHGWLRVPKQELIESGVVDCISPCSYIKDGYIYLEEDCDLATFVDAVGYDCYSFKEAFKEIKKEEYDYDKNPIYTYERFDPETFDRY